MYPNQNAMKPTFKYENSGQYPPPRNPLSNPSYQPATNPSYPTMSPYPQQSPYPQPIHGVPSYPSYPAPNGYSSHTPPPRYPAPNNYPPQYQQPMNTPYPAPNACPQDLSQVTRKYKIREKLFSFGDNFAIKDEYDQTILQVEGKVFAIGDKLTIKDVHGK